ncbi:MAG: (2Fe-2S)-binding protein [Dehalococcoidia bacterium]|nr:(2Fe-2S)-binding protein [Dehalococcoidia bacterium]
MVRVYTARALRELRDGTERVGWPEKPVLLWGSRRDGVAGQAADTGATTRVVPVSSAPPHADGISFTLNGRPVTLHGAHGKTLLRALREDAGLTGTKEGCAEGECGACTVWLDGVAVMSCLVSAERAAGCDIVTVEGLSIPLAVHGGEAEADESLHPLQRAFIDAGAVQCGYCTPGILMSAANLMQEVTHPTLTQVKEALTGNLCRCTGYYKILEAVEAAASTEAVASVEKAVQ